MNTGRPIEVPAQQAVSKLARLTPAHFIGALRFVGLLLLPLVAALIATVLYFDVLPKAEERLLVTLVAVFAGALVAGLSGFAFSAIAGAILFHWLPPLEAVPLLLACSITTQCFGIAKFWRVIAWRSFAPYVAGGLLGIPIGALLLTRLNADVFAVGFGVFLIVYCTYMVLRPRLVIAHGGHVSEVAVGFLGGVTGGATAFPGAIPTMWCSARGLGKEQQRGIVQPYILAMQIATLIYFSRTGLLSSGLWATFAWCLPAVVIGTLVGFTLFNRIDEAKFKRITLMFLFVSGVLLAL
jgi:uncharacterized membrane protein YfcA